jgi:hypothetical protein
MSNTRTFLVTMAAFSMFALPATADDDQPHNWSGFYVGGNLGAGSSNNSIGITTDSFNAKPPLSALDQGAGTTSLEPAGARASLPALQRPARTRPNNP